jgi:hypothetical protein
MFGGWAYRSRWFNHTRSIRQRKHTAAMNAKMWSNTHDASASAEVVVGSKICLYWSRDGSAWPVDAPPELLPALGGPVFLRAGVAI